jgi:putative addiction module component (TIGR02574 family)
MCGRCTLRQPDSFPLTDARRAELDRRVVEDDALPDDVVPLDNVKAATRVRMGR